MPVRAANRGGDYSVESIAPASQRRRARRSRISAQPKSAGSKPGPACYGTSGIQPTLTDAYLIAGYLSPKGLLGGTLPLDGELAERSFMAVAAALCTDVVSAAESAIEVATATMLAKILPFLARQGVGPTDLSLLIFGGAGGVHGPILAEEVGIRRVIVPRIPSVFCAYGGLVSNLVHDGMRTMRGAAPSAGALRQAFAELEEQGEAWVARQSFAGQVNRLEHVYLADMRYAAQSFTIPVDITAAMAGGDPIGMSAEAFHAEHDRLFGHALRDAPVAMDDVRLKTIGYQTKPPATKLPLGTGISAASVSTRPIRYGGRVISDVPVHAWSGLAPGWSTAGPAIIEQDLATILVPPSYVARIGEFGDLDLSSEA